MAQEGITPRSADYSRWYTDVIAAADMAEHSTVKGCMVIKPWGYAIWENIQRLLDRMFKETGHVNAYFPLFIPESFLKKEAEHVEGFAPECAVVTHAGGKELEEALIIRPTSETIICSAYARWVQSYRDLPILINQWANVVRWEMRPRLFLRTCEFLWQEGHTVHATEAEAREETMRMLGVYKTFAESCLAIGILAGRKSDAEKFAGAVDTYAIEALMQDNKALQAGTSHFLGQNFTIPFGIQFLSEQGKQEYAWETSWGVSTRLIGAVIMSHGDDKGLVLPPKIAPAQVVWVPIFKKDEQKAALMDVAKRKRAEFPDPLLVKIDDRDNLRPGAKFFEWEKKGVPIRIEFGPRDLEAGSVIAVRRDTSEKMTLPLDGLTEKLLALLDEIQANLLSASRRRLEERTFDVNTYAELREVVDTDKGLARCGWSGDTAIEAKIKEETKATIRCIPLGGSAEGRPCIGGQGPAKYLAVFGKAY